MANNKPCMAEDMRFTLATVHDIPTIHAIAHECWPVAYKDVISKEQIDYMLDLMYSQTALQRQMEVENCQFVLAINNNKTIGFASFSEIQHRIFKLHKLYLISTEKGKGHGRVLVNEVFRILSLYDVRCSLELQVNKKNPAIHFYNQMGFKIKREATFDIGNGFVMDDYIMSIEITPSSKA